MRVQKSIRNLGGTSATVWLLETPVCFLFHWIVIGH